MASITYTFEVEIGTFAEKRTETYEKYVEYASQAINRFMAKNLRQRWALPAFVKGGA